MDPHHPFEGYGEEPERIVKPQVFLCREGKFAEVLEALDIGGLYPRLRHLVAVIRHRGIDPFDLVLQAF